MPAHLAAAIHDVAMAYDLPVDWLNAGPASLLDLGLPEGFLSRARVERYGALTIYLADRFDQVHFKLYAAADHWPDHSKHLQDLLALEASSEELREAARWCRTHDASIGFWQRQLVPVLTALDCPYDDLA